MEATTNKQKDMDSPWLWFTFSFEFFGNQEEDNKNLIKITPLLWWLQKEMQIF